VRLSGWLLESGEVMLSVEDEGIGVTSRRLSALNARLSLPDGQQPPEMEEAAGTQSKDRSPEAGLGMGLYVVARLASRHGLRVQLREGKQGGITAVIAVPSSLLPVRPTPLGAQGDGARVPAPASRAFPGSVAEANSNALPARRAPTELSGAGTAGEAATEAAPPEPESEPEPEPEAESGSASEPVGAPEDAADDPVVAAAEQAVRDQAPAEDPAPDSMAQGSAPDSVPAPRPDSVPEQHGRAQADVSPDEAARPGTSSDERTAADPATDPAEPALGADETASAQAATPAEPPAEAVPDAPTEPSPGQRFTDKGLPKRTPQQVAAQPDPGQPRQQSANAEELRRRLGGFQQGAQHGRRDAAAEKGASEAGGSAADQSGAQSDGGTAEEART
jgi:hypothetical protein